MWNLARRIVEPLPASIKSTPAAHVHSPTDFTITFVVP
jgi:hypothetical protein